MKGFWLNCVFIFGVCVISTNVLSAFTNVPVVPECTSEADDCRWLGGVSGCSAGLCNVQASCSCTGTTKATCEYSCK